MGFATVTFHDFARGIDEHLGYVLYTFLAYWLSGLVHTFKENRKKKRFRIRDFVASAREEVQIRQYLRDARTKLGACNAFLWAIHNGGEWSSGKSMHRVTRMYEEPDGNTVPQATQFVSDLIVTLPGLMEMILESGPSFTPVEKLPVGKLRWLMECGGRKAMALEVIVRGETPLACVVFEFKTVEYDATGKAKEPPNLSTILGDTRYKIDQSLMGYG